MSRLYAFALASTLLACAPQSDTHVALADDSTNRQRPTTVAEPDTREPLVLEFGWAPGRMGVIEQVNKKGVDATMHYTLDVAERDGVLMITYRDFRFTAIQGMDFADPAVRAEITQLERTMASGIPAFQINSVGEFVRLHDTEALVAIIAEVEGPKAGEDMRKMLADPHGRTILEESVAKPWRAWVEVWIGLDVAPGEVLEGDAEIELLGAPITQHLVYEHLGPDPLRPGHVRLRHRERVDDVRFMVTLGNLGRGVTEEIDAKIREAIRGAANNLEFVSVREIEISMNPRNMLPTHVEDVWRVTLRDRTVAPGITHERLETHEWTFSVIDD